LVTDASALTAEPSSFSERPTFYLNYLAMNTDVTGGKPIVV
jgi:hypothetical protein